MNILLFPSGSAVAKEIYDSLKFEKYITLYGTDYNEDNVSSFYMENYIPKCPFVSDEIATLAFLKDLIQKYDIDYIYPAFDNVIEFLVTNEANIGCTVIAPDIEVIRTCNSKLITYKLLEDVVRTPKLFDPTRIDELEYPLYVKPIVGYGSRGHKIIKCAADLQNINFSQNLLLECLPGNEFTVDCITDHNGTLLFAQPRQRCRTIMGMSVLSKIVELPETWEIAKAIQLKLKCKGAWFFQVKYNSDGQLTLLEVACRIPGAISVNRARGINFPLLTILIFQEKNVNPILYNNIDVECHKIYCNRYKYKNISYNTIYCDLDDTIIIKDKLNTELVSFLFDSAVNKKKRIVLITRSSESDKLLSNYRLTCLFDEILTVPRPHKKSDLIPKDKSAIFIDDAWSERYDVHSNCNILCFSTYDIELLANGANQN
jgi:hypothetical protein